MEWELLLICNCLGLIALALIFFYHFADVDEEEDRQRKSEQRSSKLYSHFRTKFLRETSTHIVNSSFISLNKSSEVCLLIKSVLNLR